MDAKKKERVFSANVENVTIGEATKEMLSIKAKLNDLLEDMGRWRSKHLIVNDNDYDDAVSASIEIEDVINLWMVKSIDEKLKVTSFTTM